ncbi:MAG: allophanate hydrolase subunit 1 [Proteobacteria bacterium]|nr:allophanate hydrolase subunit 1 [Pseudomonadota bacterium]
MKPSAAYAAPRLLPLGDAAWTVEFGASIDMTLHARVMGLAGALEELRSSPDLLGVSEWVPSFRSLTVHFDPLLTDADALGATLFRLSGGEVRTLGKGRRWLIPVCFGGDAGPDLDDMATTVGLSAAEVIACIAATVFRVYLLGFMPGFPYMGGLTPELSLPRLATPRKVVPERSLAVTGTMCAIYPWESPGGWRLLGRTPVRLFDPGAQASPALFGPGDEAMWLPIDADTFLRMDEQAARGDLAWEQFQLAADASWPAR